MPKAIISPRVTFVIVIEEEPPPKDFSLKDLPKASKIDVVSRCILAIFPQKKELVKGRLFALFTAGAPPQVLEVAALPPKDDLYDEIEVAAIIRAALRTTKETAEQAKAEQRTEEERAAVKWWGITNFESFIQKIVSEGNSLFYLHETGKPFGEVIAEGQIPEKMAFFLGGRVDISFGHEIILENYGARRISLGRRAYLASTCIVSVLYELEKS